ncbi:CaiB/BaiF CoA transferase family protein [Labrys monachus]|uniref:Crotonobetainyl-CoA:carnitine CoA-transferase CaiB-like acyl-CoA transferase n=1 Tax=Labrys monachus TaxID=217067 RepID=A0ABU0F9K8_9HYPH|nr:CoA transferase [Labrys monachus]MDQ0391298.1 crotonobetainyl-CoA:carnitine CoA-transferase CaiB-like acyl-CoA transferase [Labrys monachus]
MSADAAGQIDQDMYSRPGIVDSDADLLAGIRVLEIGHFVAAPFCSRLLADLGADVIKIEPPIKGDPVRQWGAGKDGHSVWWSVHGRNKRCIGLNLKHPAARQIVLDLVRECDALVENFRPGHLARLGLDDETLRSVRPDLVIAHISGYGQDGPQRDRAAFGVIGEAVGGLRYLTNHPAGETDQPPVRVGVSIGDSIAGLYAAFGVVSGLLKRAAAPRARPASLDIALADSVFSMLEGALPEYGALGIVRQPSGGRIPTAAPTNAYQAADGSWMIVAANSDALFRKLCGVMGRRELPQDARFADNPARVAHVVELDAIISAWTATLEASDLETLLAAADIPATRAYTIEDCARDEQFLFRGMVRDIDDPLIGPVLHPGIVPRVMGREQAIRWAGPDVGHHTDEVLTELLGMAPADIAQLRGEGAF